MTNYFINILIILLTVSFSTCKTTIEPESEDDLTFSVPDPYEQNELLFHSINLGNALEAPNEGDWGVTLDASYFKIVKDAGFSAVRIPVRWSNHTLSTYPYTLEPGFLSRVDWAIEQSFQNDLAVIINVHHFGELMEDPHPYLPKLYKIWEQLADHYKNYSNKLILELLNEPNAAFTADLWNEIHPELIQTIRNIDSTRTLIIGTANWGGLDGLKSLSVPDSISNLIITFHYYNPFHFTHQGAE